MESRAEQIGKDYGGREGRREREICIPRGREIVQGKRSEDNVSRTGHDRPSRGKERGGIRFKAIERITHNGELSHRGGKNEVSIHRGDEVHVT